MNAGTVNRFPRPRAHRIAALLLAIPAIVLLGASPALAATYVGADTCADCHEEVADALKMTPHGKDAFGRLSEHGCETCHGPASEHVDDPDNESLRPKISNISASELSDTCLGCHEGGQQTFWRGGQHESRGLSCTNCHGIHDFKSLTAQLKEKGQQDTCFECHKQVRAETRKTSHHPLREGKISCTDCHNPHGAVGPKMITEASVNDQCYRCHAEKRGPFLWEHAPVRESCLNCHTPHGSNHLKLTKTANPFLCQQCHSNTRHPGTPYDGDNIVGGSSPSNRIFNRACNNCHANIHGSNHPSGPYLGR